MVENWRSFKRLFVLLSIYMETEITESVTDRIGPWTTIGRQHDRLVQRADSIHDASTLAQTRLTSVSPSRHASRRLCANDNAIHALHDGDGEGPNAAARKGPRGRRRPSTKASSPPKGSLASDPAVYERRAARGATRVARAPRPCASALGRDPNPGRALLCVSSSYPNRTTGPSEHYSMPFRLVGLSHNSHCPQAVLGGSN